MADDTTTDETSETSTTETDTTTATTADETSTGTGEDVTGLKSALDAERTQRKAAEKELKKLRGDTEAVRQASMTDQEKAVNEAEKRGRTAAALDNGKRLASAELRAHAAAKGVDLSAIGDLIDTARFVDDTGDVDLDAIKKAVDKLAKAAPAKPGAGRGSGDFPGGTGAGAPITEEQLAQMSPQQVTDAYNAGKLKHLM